MDISRPDSDQSKYTKTRHSLWWRQITQSILMFVVVIFYYIISNTELANTEALLSREIKS